MITIHPQPGQTMADLTRHLITLAGGDDTAVTSSSMGMTVSDELGHAYLAGLLTAMPIAQTPLAQPVSPALAAMIRGVEDGGGLIRPLADAENTTTTVARPRRGARRSLARTEEQVHG